MLVVGKSFEYVGLGPSCGDVQDVFENPVGRMVVIGGGSSGPKPQPQSFPRSGNYTIETEAILSLVFYCMESGR